MHVFALNGRVTRLSSHPANGRSQTPNLKRRLRGVDLQVQQSIVGTNANPYLPDANITQSSPHRFEEPSSTKTI